MSALKTESHVGGAVLEKLKANLSLVPRYSSADERVFCGKWMRNLEQYLYRGVLPFTGVLDLVLIFAAPTLVHSSNVIYMQMTHAFHLALVIAIQLLKSHPVPVRMLGLLTATVLMAGYGFIAYRCNVVIREPMHEVMGATCFLAATFFSLQGCGFDKRYSATYLVAATVTTVLCMGSSRVGWPWVGLFGSLMVMSWYFHAGRIDRALDEARREFRLRGKIAPAHIVRRSGGDEAELHATFEPQIRRSVCISSDWRNYQKLSRNMDPKRLALALNEYYDLCYSLLKKQFPEGNYYTDWIADELFIVVFVEDGKSEKSIVNASLQFACALTQAKEVFRGSHGLPAAIDIGVAFGATLTGMMGPEGFRKATALGEIPGRARRLQATGKLLRIKFGERDRVLFDEDVLMLIKLPFDVKAFEMTPNKRQRDLPFGSLFYVEPNEEKVFVADLDVA